MLLTLNKLHSLGNSLGEEGANDVLNILYLEELVAKENIKKQARDKEIKKVNTGLKDKKRSAVCRPVEFKVLMEHSFRNKS